MLGMGDGDIKVRGMDSWYRLTGVRGEVDGASSGYYKIMEEG